MNIVKLKNSAEQKRSVRFVLGFQQSKVPINPRQTTTVSQNAVAGGIAGGIVSFFVYPIDTVKTILQASKEKQANALPALLKVVNEKGFLKLYKGLGASLATAAPISAIYASTYESVKGFLVPRLPKDWVMVAHCIAGGAASVATSAVYTPSEVIKQRLQLSTEYKSSLAAFIGIMRNEGILSLYSGLGAVLCRNVPQSVIKFLTYETLKKMAIEKQTKNKETLHTSSQLLIGGLAGSTAAVFTTPFDVIKTRMQAKGLGVAKYKSVGEAFFNIWRHEGISGLYRGVIPRLLIYMSQGAIFFASYELLKIVLRESFTKIRATSQLEKKQVSEELKL